MESENEQQFSSAGGHQVDWQQLLSSVSSLSELLDCCIGAWDDDDASKAGGTRTSGACQSVVVALFGCVPDGCAS